MNVVNFVDMAVMVLQQPIQLVGACVSSFLPFPWKSELFEEETFAFLTIILLNFPFSFFKVRINTESRYNHFGSTCQFIFYFDSDFQNSYF